MRDEKKNPYVGPRTFRIDEGHLFFGRERETLDLLSLVMSERLVLFYAQSGAGKSSLINTKLIPGLLAEEEYKILPVGRVGGSELSSEPDIDNIYIYNLIKSLIQHDFRKEVLSKLSLAKFLGGLEAAKENNLKQVLIIDQFEELFSFYQEEWEKRKDFLTQLAQAMQDFPRLWIVLVMREDYIAYLDPYVYLLPERLRVRYYMQRLEWDAALKAIKEPVKDLRPYADGVAEKLVDDLRSIKVLRPDGKLHIQPGQYVEPLQLQVICYNLWENLSPGGTQITEQNLQDVGDVNTTLANYYAARVKAVAESKNIKERKIREWFTDKLIAPGGMRNMVLREPGGKSGGMKNHIIDEFSDLIRAEQRGGTTFYELTHDRLVEPIIANNKNWFDENLSPLQRQATVWNDQGRSDIWLLTDQALVEIEEWAKENSDELTDAETDFLDACRKQQQQIAGERESQRRELEMAQTLATEQASSAQRARRFNVIAFSLLVIAILTLIFAFSQRNAAIEMSIQAEYYAGLGLAHQLVEQSKAQLNNRYDLTLLLGIEAYRINKSSETSGNLLADLNSPNLIGFMSSHKGRVSGLSLSPDGKTLASGSGDNTIILWDMSNPDGPIQIGEALTGHEDDVDTVAFSPDGKTLASGSWDNTIILWDVSNPDSPTQVGGALTGHEGDVNTVAFSPDGKTLASGSDDNTIILWDVSNPDSPTQVGGALTGHEDDVHTVAFSPDGKTLASGSWDNTIILWDMSNPDSPTQVGGALTGHEGDVYTVAFSPDGKTLASGSWKEIILWDVSDPMLVKQLGEPLSLHINWVETVAFSPDGKTLASSSDDKSIILWDVSNLLAPHQVGASLLGHSKWVGPLIFSPDGTMLISGSGDQTIRLWNVSDPKLPIQLGVPLTGHQNWIGSVVFSPDGTILASGSGDTTVRLWDVSQPNSATQLGVSPHGHTDGVTSVAFSPDGKVLASGSYDDTVILWDVSDPKSITPVGLLLSDHTDNVNSVAFSPDGKILASGSADNTIILWDVSDSKLPAPIGSPLSGHTDGVYSIAFNPDGKLLASGSYDDTVILWDVSDPHLPAQLGAPLSQHTDDINSVAFSPDGKILASGSTDNTIILWDVSDPRSVTQLGAPLSAHKNDVYSLAFSRDGKTLASGSVDNTIILWDVTNPLLPIRLGNPLAGHSGSVWTVTFSPDGKILVSGSDDQTIRLWDVNADAWVRSACEIVGRNFTKAEWAKYLPGEEYRSTCPQWPAGQ